MKLIMSILLVVLLALPAAGQQATSIEVEGLGTNYEAALSDALRKAVEQGVGMVISSETLVKNYQLADDMILSKASGFVKSYSEVSRREDQGGKFVKIRAEVTAILDEVVKDQAALDFILARMKQPKFMILLDESIRFLEDGKEVTSSAASMAFAGNNYGGRAAAVSATESKTKETEKKEATHQEIAAVQLGRILSEKGFSIYDKQTLADKYKAKMVKKGMKAEEVDLSDLGTIEKMEKAAMLLAQSGHLKSDYIITGNAVATGPASKFTKNRHAGQATITAKVIRTADGKMMAQNTFQNKKSHVNSRVAAEKALGLAAGDVAAYLMAETVRKWSLMQTGGVTLELSLTGVADVDYEASMLIEDYFKADGSVKGVEVRNWDADEDEAEISVVYKGAKRDFERLIMKSSFDGFKMKIKKKQGNTYSLKLEKK